MNPWLIIRADASSEMGIGHVMRMVALGQSWSDLNGHVEFVCADCPVEIQRRIEHEGFSVTRIPAVAGSLEDVEQTCSRVCKSNAHWVVLDGYQFDHQYQQRLSRGVGGILMLDDFRPELQYCVDAILNQNVYADHFEYRSSLPNLKTFLGLKFALLRREFREFDGIRKLHRPLQNNVLISAGGSDPQNCTSRILQILNDWDDQVLNVRVIIGPANQYAEQIKSIGRFSPHRLCFKENVANMAKEYAWADAVVGAGGSSCWEWIYFGLPGVVFSLASNQNDICRTLHERGLAISLGEHGEISSPESTTAIREFLAALCSGQLKINTNVIDGSGAERVARWLRNEQLNSDGLRQNSANSRNQ